MIRALIAVAAGLSLAIGGAFLYAAPIGPCKIDNRAIALDSLAAMIEVYALDHDRLPPDLDALLVGTEPNWQGPYARPRNLVDPWGSRIRYATLGEPHSGFRLVLVGSDNQFGGTGGAADRELTVAWLPSNKAFKPTAGDVALPSRPLSAGVGLTLR
jgi:hypothetical protein